MVSIESEISAAVAAFDRAPEWVRALPIENSDRVIAQRIREATAAAYRETVVVVDVASGFHAREVETGNVRNDVDGGLSTSGLSA